MESDLDIGNRASKCREGADMGIKEHGGCHC